MALNMLLDQVKNAVMQHSDQHNQQGGGTFDPSNLMGTIEGLFGQHQQAQTQPQGMDPYGGLPNEAGGFGNVKPASQDPYGDPADQQGGQMPQGFGNIKPASQDPYGDPADQR